MGTRKPEGKSYSVWLWARSIIKEKKYVTSLDVQQQFGYSTKSASSALQHLCQRKSMMKKGASKRGMVCQFFVTELDPSRQDDPNEGKPEPGEVVRFERNGLMLGWEHLPIVQLRG